MWLPVFNRNLKLARLGYLFYNVYMQQKISTIFVVLFLVYLFKVYGLWFMVPCSQAQTTLPGLEEIAQELEAELPKVKVLPGQALYYLKILKEKIEIFTTFGAPNKARVFLKFARERMAEYQALRAQGKDKLAERVLEKYLENLNQAIQNLEKAEQKGESFEEVADEIALTTEIHLHILKSLYAKVPESAKQGIRRAIEASQQGIKITSEILSGQHRGEVQQKAKEIKEKTEKGIKGVFKELWPTLLK